MGERGNVIRQSEKNEHPEREPGAGLPVNTGEAWLGRNRSAGRKLWERLNPRSRAQLRVLAEALALAQIRAHLPDEIRARIERAVEELERITARMRALLAEVARRTPPRG